MFPRAAIVLALAASFVGVQAMDQPKPQRELIFMNETSPATAKARAKTVAVCFTRVNYNWDLVCASPKTCVGSAGFQALISSTVFKCADIATNGVVNAGAVPIGIAGYAID
jgi:hypothetical protein